MRDLVVTTKKLYMWERMGIQNISLALDIHALHKEEKWEVYRTTERIRARDGLKRNRELRDKRLKKTGVRHEAVLAATVDGGTVPEVHRRCR
jgi:hypothetical protein